MHYPVCTQIQRKKSTTTYCYTAELKLIYDVKINKIPKQKKQRKQVSQKFVVFVILSLTYVHM